MREEEEIQGKERKKERKQNRTAAAAIVFFDPHLRLPPLTLFPSDPNKTTSNGASASASAAEAKARMLTQAPAPRGADDPEPATVEFGTEGNLALSGLCTAAPAAAAKKTPSSGPEPVSACFWRVEEVPQQQQKTKARFHVEF